MLEATSVSSAAWLAGSGLLSFTWPGQMDHTLRDDWLDQQTETAWVLADDLAGADWSTLSLPVDGVPDAVPLPRVRVRLGAGRLHRRRACTWARTGAG